jgi:hypothetical protein
MQQAHQEIKQETCRAIDTEEKTGMDLTSKLYLQVRYFCKNIR